MKQIAFKNFRKFEDFPAIDLGGITILVGSNNAGKSTVVKALQLVRYNLISLVASTKNEAELEEDEQDGFQTPMFNFAPPTIHEHIHIGTFSRALHNNSKTDTICFETNYNDLHILMEIKGNQHPEGSKIPIAMLMVEDPDYGIHLKFDYARKRVQVVLDKFVVPYWKVFSEKRMNRFRDKQLNRMLDFPPADAQVLVDKLKIYSKSDKCTPAERKRAHDLMLAIRKYVSGYSIPEERYPMKNTMTFKALQKEFEKGREQNPYMMCYKIGGIPVCPRPTRYREEGADENAMTQNQDFLFFQQQMEVLNEKIAKVLHSDMEYIYAHAVSQNTLYRHNNTGDYMTETIQTFYLQNICNDDAVMDFIYKWMDILEIGSSFEIMPIAGAEAYIFKVKDKQGRELHLADKGMGSIQMMILLLKMGILVKKFKSTKLSRSQKPIIIIEEPEQNLHPSLQSKLADLFYEINRKFNIRFVIETHSEYLVRRSQVIVSELQDHKEEGVENPFKVYYFPEDGSPYDMQYREDGIFVNKFGEGFFNEAKKQIYDLL